MAEIIYRNTVDLDPLYHNPRYIKEPEFVELCKSITDNPDYFEGRPLLLSNRTGLLVVIAGNMKLKGAIHLGIKQVPTFLLEGLTEEREREIIIRDNVNNGSWDYDMLANEWDKEQLIDWGVPAMWDLKTDDDSAGSGAGESLESYKITIEFSSGLQRDQARTEIEELLRSYDGAEIR